MNRRAERPQCIRCRHFKNSPEFLETVFKGLTALSSAYGSVRSEDGICIINGRYLAANRCCDQFLPYPSKPSQKRPPEKP